MDVEQETDARVSRIAAAIGEPARARMLYCLMGNRARTSTELAMVADVSPSTASAHLSRLQAEGLVKVLVQGKHRYYSVRDRGVAKVLEALSVLAGTREPYVPTTPLRLRAARTCYDHMAGTLGVLLHDRLMTLGWLMADTTERDDALGVTPKGMKAFAALGIDVDETRQLRRRFAFACLDWSERRAHVGGALGGALLTLALERKWVAQDRDDRSLRITPAGERGMSTHFGLVVPRDSAKEKAKPATR
jgi:DNA-binding transcriptional ArsR family regulator